MAEQYKSASTRADALGLRDQGSPARRVKLAAVAAGLMLLSACAHGSPGSLEYDTVNKGEDGKSRGGLFGGGKKDAERVGVGVNSFLWRASLDTMSFMPLASADPYGGTIITDWYANPEVQNERFKATVYILDQHLRSDALRVSVFRQVRGTGGNWADAASDPRTATKLENAILMRAREMRIAAINK